MSFFKRFAKYKDALHIEPLSSLINGIEEESFFATEREKQIATQWLTTELHSSNSYIRALAIINLGAMGKIDALSDIDITECLIGAILEKESFDEVSVADMRSALNKFSLIQKHIPLVFEALVEELLTNLNSTEPNARCRAAECLVQLDKSGDAIRSKYLAGVNGLVAILHDTTLNADLRCRAATKLTVLSGSDDPTRMRGVNELITAMHDQDANVRCRAAETLVELQILDDFGRLCGIRGLLATLGEQDDSMQDYAVESLVTLGQSIASVYQSVIDGALELLHDAKSTTRKCAITILSRLWKSDAPQSSVVINELVVKLSDTDPSIRRASAHYLGELKIGDKSTHLSVVNGLTKAQADEDSEVRYRIAASLGLLNVISESVPKDLIDT